MRRFIARWYPVLLVVLAASASLAVYGQLPERMPIHFDVDGSANGWASRPVGAFFPPVLILLLWGVFTAAPKLDPRRANYERFDGAYALTMATALTMVFVLHLLVLALALGHPVPMQRILPLMLGIFLTVIGNVLPRARSNFMYGIRTPWTLSSERVWTRTHRIAGYLMTLAGLGMIVASVALPAAAIGPLIIAATVAAVGFPVIYSYVAWRQEQRS